MTITTKSWTILSSWTYKRRLKFFVTKQISLFGRWVLIAFGEKPLFFKHDLLWPHKITAEKMWSKCFCKQDNLAKDVNAKHLAFLVLSGEKNVWLCYFLCSWKLSWSFKMHIIHHHMHILSPFFDICTYLCTDWTISFLRNPK